MPGRRIASTALATFMGVLSHHERISIIEELRHGEKDVGTLAETVRVPQARVSQHLALLRSHHVVAERRDGRHVLYRLNQPILARWLLEGLQFVAPAPRDVAELDEAVKTAVSCWSDTSPEPASWSE